MCAIIILYYAKIMQGHLSDLTYLCHCLNVRPFEDNLE